jgi:hypothetical protein
MIQAIVYNSRTGSCRRYAEELSKALELPVYSLDQLPAALDGEVIFVSWLMAGSITGYAKLIKKASVAAVCAVGMAPVLENSVQQGRQKNRIPGSVAYFCLQGGFHMDKLPLGMQLVMRAVCKDIARKLEVKMKTAALNEQEQATYTMATQGAGEPASWDVSEIVAWAKAR